MCGISGAANVKDPIMTVAKIAENQTGRGQDSTGVAFPLSGGFRIIKRVCTPKQFIRDNLAKLQIMAEGKPTSAIGHNRWPSHGKVDINNAHPFRACDNSFALVHNGSMAPPKGWKEYLASKGHTVHGDTDSELMTHVIESFLRANGADRLAALRSFAKLCQSFSILTLFPDGEIWGVRDYFPAVIVQRSPKVGGTLVASEEGGFEGIVGDTEVVRIMTPKEGTVYRVEPNGDLTFWGDYDKAERPLHLEWQTKAYSEEDYYWGDNGIVTLGTTAANYKYPITPYFPPQRGYQSHLPIAGNCEITSKKERKRLRKEMRLAARQGLFEKEILEIEEEERTEELNNDISEDYE